MQKLFLALATLLLSLNVLALDLESAREQGLVGEKSSGYVGLVVSGNTEAAALVVNINQQRKLHYQEIANKQNTALANIETIAGEKLVNKARSEGFYYQAADGSWTKD
jgi:uncharacterized protein